MICFAGVEGKLDIKPQNIIEQIGEDVTLQCASNATKGRIAWSTTNIENYIYSGNVLDPAVSSYIYVDERDDGSCNLMITASATAAQRYICIDRVTGDNASADLTVVGKFFSSLLAYLIKIYRHSTVI